MGPALLVCGIIEYICYDVMNMDPDKDYED